MCGRSLHRGAVFHQQVSLAERLHAPGSPLNLPPKRTRRVPHLVDHRPVFPPAKVCSSRYAGQVCLISYRHCPPEKLAYTSVLCSVFYLVLAKLDAVHSKGHVSDERPNQHSRSAGMETWYPNLHSSFGSGPLQLFPLLRYLRRRSSLRALHLDVYGPQGGDFCGQNKLFALCDLIRTLNLFLQIFPKNHDSQILIFCLTLKTEQNR